MAKGNGGTRTTNSSSSHGNANGNNSQTFASAKRQGFTNNGGGSYDLDTPYGGGQVLAIDGPGYDGRTYESLPWDSDYNMGERKVFSSLSAAKEYARSMMKDKK